MTQTPGSPPDPERSSQKIRCPQCGDWNYVTDALCLGCGRESQGSSLGASPVAAAAPVQEWRQEGTVGSGTVALALGILSLLLGYYWLYGLLLGPAAWIVANKALGAIERGKAETVSGARPGPDASVGSSAHSSSCWSLPYSRWACFSVGAARARLRSQRTPRLRRSAWRTSVVESRRSTPIEAGSCCSTSSPPGEGRAMRRLRIWRTRSGGGGAIGGSS
jgi:hypothetical protein